MTTFANHTPIPSTDNSECQNGYVERGRILPVKHGTLPRARCGECGRMFKMHPDAHNIHDELERHKWKYTLINGWVCDRCAPQRRLKQGEPNRAAATGGAI